MPPCNPRDPCFGFPRFDGADGDEFDFLLSVFHLGQETIERNQIGVTCFDEHDPFAPGRPFCAQFTDGAEIDGGAEEV